MTTIERLAKDHNCGSCKGTGRRGRGACKPCEGRGTADLKHPRIRFNWGYHDAAGDCSRGSCRRVVSEGAQTVDEVSYSFDHWYAAGYEAGMFAVSAGCYGLPGGSEHTWLELVGAEADRRYAWRSKVSA